MSASFFGTDGIRGQTSLDDIDEEGFREMMRDAHELWMDRCWHHLLRERSDLWRGGIEHEEFDAMMMARMMSAMNNYPEFRRGYHKSLCDPEYILDWFRGMYYYCLTCAVQEEHESAVKIQAMFRGHNVRWKVPCFTWGE